MHVAFAPTAGVAARYARTNVRCARAEARWLCTARRPGRAAWELREDGGKEGSHERDGRRYGGDRRWHGRDNEGYGREQRGYDRQQRGRREQRDWARGADQREGRVDDRTYGGERGREWDRGGGGTGGGRGREWDRGEGGTRGEAVSEETGVIRAALDSGDELVYGVNPVLLALQAGKREYLKCVFVQKAGRGSGGGPSKKADNWAAMEKTLEVADGRGMAVHRVSKGGLNALCGNRPHQGVVLQAGRRELSELTGLPEVDATTRNARGAVPVWVALDEVSDPHNAGALLRSAHFLGADGVAVCRRNSCGLTPAVSKASAGAAEVMEVHGVASMPRFLRAARGRGWRVVGLGRAAGSAPLRGERLERATVVVLGSEGRGLRALVRQACDVVVRIDGARDAGGVDSLNVSVAGGIALYQLLGR